MTTFMVGGGEKKKRGKRMFRTICPPQWCFLSPPPQTEGKKGYSTGPHKPKEKKRKGRPIVQGESESFFFEKGRNFVVPPLPKPGSPLRKYLPPERSHSLEKPEVGTPFFTRPNGGDKKEGKGKGENNCSPRTQRRVWV